MIGHLSKYTVYAGDRGAFQVDAYDKRHAVAAVVARLGLTEPETESVTEWSVVVCGSRKPTSRGDTPPLAGYTVYARDKGRFRVEAYGRRHAVAMVVARLGLTERESKIASSWSVSEENDLNNRKEKTTKPTNQKEEAR